MFRPLSLYIGLRYTRAKRRNHFISFISLTSMLGIAVGVAVLITVLSVMNGFDEEIHEQFFSMTPQLTVVNYQGSVSHWEQLANQVEQYPGVVGIAPFVGGQGLLTRSGRVLPVLVNGILPQQESGISNLADNMVVGELNALTSGGFGIVLGQQIASQLGLAISDQVTLMIPQANVSPVGISPRFKRFRVVGIFSAGGGFSFDASMAFINLEDAQVLFQMGEDVSGLQVKIDNIYAAPIMANQLSQQLPEDFSVRNWTEQYGPFFQAIKLEKNMMFLILALIIAVAAFNLVSSLIMLVTDKQPDIAILRTLGALPRTILATFMIQGVIIGVAGLLMGLIGGITLSLNATEVVNWIQGAFHVQLVSESVYFLDYLPAKIQVSDLVSVSLVALIMSFLATLYPAWRAARVQPAEALRYE